MNNSKFKTFIIRFLIIYSIQLIIKAFDYSFDGFFDFTYRGILFSVFLIIMWVGGWYLGEYVNKRIRNIKQIYKVLINIVLGYSITFLSNMGYRLGDIHLYGNADLWKDIPEFNPEFTVSMLLIYMMIFWFNEFFLVNIKIKEDEINAQKMQKESTMAQYMALKAQVEPHFLFNSLSVLNSIVYKDVDLASEFIVKLSKTLRYIVEKNDVKLVLLKDEIQIVQDYFFLLKIRFNDTIRFINNIDKKLYEKIFVPPVTIQILIENAVNHNKKSIEKPLEIILESSDEYITVRNTMNKKAEKKDTTGKGLQNISQRYKLIAKKDIIINKDEYYFVVKLPLLKKEDYEYFNN